MYKRKHIYIYERYVCLMQLCIYVAGQTAGPNWLTFFEETHGYPVFPSKFDLLFYITGDAGHFS